MPAVYRPIDAGWIKDPYIRALVDEINRTLRDWSVQFNTATTAAQGTPGTGVVNSIRANAGPLLRGDLVFANTSTIDVTAVASFPPNPHIFTWNVDVAAVAALLGPILGDVPAIAYADVPLEGVAPTFIRTDATLPLPADVPVITYGTAFVEGAAATLIRTNATLVFPEALGTLADRTDNLTLTDDATEGALLTAANTFSVNGIALKAPNSTNTLRVGKYGNISMAGSTLSDTVLVQLSKTDYNEVVFTRAASYTITNTNVGSGGIISQGLVAGVTGSCLNAAASTTNIVNGANLTLSGGNATNNNFLGNLIGYRVSTFTLNTQTAGTVIPLVVGFECGNAASPLIATRVALTDYMAFRARMGATLITSATLTNATGFRCEAITQGTNRYGVDVAAITTGTPTVSYGIQVGTHSVGTTRRAGIGGNTWESTANDFLCSTTAKGFIAKDGAGTPHYWRYTVGATGTPAIVDTGTTAPTT